ncbi:MAG: hypothetical protein AAFU41_16510 [Pseudomonadota bacterium]
MAQNDQSPDHHVAYGAAVDSFVSATSGLAVVGRYVWNLQMKLIMAAGAMRYFRAQPRLFVALGLLLLAFALPIGIVFVVSALCAGALNPKGDDGFIVPLKPLKRDMERSEPHQAPAPEPTKAAAGQLDMAKASASIHLAGFLRAAGTDLSDTELAATALGALDGTVQALGMELSSLDMHSAGAAFVVEQLQQLDRLQELDPDRIADLTVNAMSSTALAPARERASLFAFKAEQITGFGQV